ncbi:MAG: NAD-dependent deacetylase [Campylobacteraceae bacterium 4484_166]|nr:MAG: NAD-dependent deacetylase [Campylobacteraceae bacterium 4484_166]
MSKVIIFTGAGISAQSGISTFRDSGGLWEQYRIEDICTAGCLETNRQETIEFYDKRREDIKDKKPNYAHKQIKLLQDKYPNSIKLITQNVDDMFEKAGCVDVLHLHGFLKNVVCPKCGYKHNIGYSSLKSFQENCPRCNCLLRPDIVFFGESAPKYIELYRYLESCELLVIIGTSGYVIDVNHLSSYATKTILNNLEPSDAIDEKKISKVIYKKATDAIDEIVCDIDNFLKGNLETLV